MKRSNYWNLFKITHVLQTKLFFFTLLFSVIVVNFSTQKVFAQSVSPVMSLDDGNIDDQDDMCIWLHPSDPSQSMIITSDKGANKLFVYDLNGNTVQVVTPPGRPGNIDIRYNFMLNGQAVDLIGFNDRDNKEIAFYTVDAATRQLSYLNSFDAGNWPEELYGFCLYRSPNDGKFYAFGSGKSSQIRQWELVDNGGVIDGVELRTWQNGSDQTEGMVADDETGYLYAANEVEGVYKYAADPTDPNPSNNMIIPTGSDGLAGDVEGITIYYAANGEGYIIVSDQGDDDFQVYDRKPPHDHIQSFSVSGAEGTDGIDVINVNLGNDFPNGLFVLHNDNSSPKENLVCMYEDLNLMIDTNYWHPRNNGMTTGIVEDGFQPAGFSLLQNYPNPFNPLTQIDFRVAKTSDVVLKIYDISGREVKTLLSNTVAAGEYSLTWDATDRHGKTVSSGIYIYRLEADGFVQSRKMQLLR